MSLSRGVTLGDALLLLLDWLLGVFDARSSFRFLMALDVEVPFA